MAEHSKWLEAAPEEPLAAVIRRALSTRLDAVAFFLKRAAKRWEQDPEYVHQLRVWSRRAAAALQLSKPLVPDSRRRRVAKHLKQIRRAANDARDDDVFAERLQRDQDDPGARRLLEAVALHRRRAQEPIAGAYRKFTRRNRLGRRTDQLVKHLRYTIELLGGAFAEPLRIQVYPMTADLQNRLGAVNDRATARERLLRWIHEADAPTVRRYLQDRLERVAVDAQRLHGEFLDWWNAGQASGLQQAFEDALGSA